MVLRATELACRPLSAIEKELQAYLRQDTFKGAVFTAKLQAGTSLSPDQIATVQIRDVARGQVVATVSRGS